MNENSYTEGQILEQSMSPPDSSTEKKVCEKIPGLPKPPLFTTDYIAMAEILEFDMERFGRLALALMYYTMDGTIPDDFPPDLKLMFGIYQRKVDAAREKYDHVRTIRAQNGARGGKAKAENGQKKSARAKFNPPTQKQFREAVQHFADEGAIAEDTSTYDADSFFDELRESGWTINGEPLQQRHDWEAAIQAKFPIGVPSGIPRHWYYLIFANIYAGFHGLRDHDGESRAGSVEDDFFDTYDEAAKCWSIQGTQFPTARWEEALARFMERYDTPSKD